MAYRIKLVVLVVAFALGGCSTAGPFVTSISSDGRGGLTIEKCMVHYNPCGFVNTSDCTTTNIGVSK